MCLPTEHVGGLSAAFKDTALKVSDGVPSCHALRAFAAREVILKAVAAIDADMKRMVRASTIFHR